MCSGQPLHSLFDKDLCLEIDRCQDCQGLWFDGDELSRFLHSRDLSARVIDEKLAAQTFPERSRECPRCSRGMAKARVNTITLDRCTHCTGLWFDQGELSRLREEAQSGLRGDSEVVRQFSLGLALETADQHHRRRREELLGLCQFLAVL